MPGRTLVERVTLFLFVAALSAVAVVFLSRGQAEVKTHRAAAEPTRVSRALALNTGPATPTPTLGEILIAADQVERARDFYSRIITPTPTLAELLVAADQVQRAQDYFERIATPTPTLAEILKAADAVQRARDFFERIADLPAQPAQAPGPTLEESMIAADQLTRFAEYVKGVTEAPPAPPPAPAPTDTPAPPPSPPPPPPPTSTPVPPPAPRSGRVEAGTGYYDLAFEAEVLSLVNQRRAQMGLGPLSVEPRLERAAKDYAKVLADNDWFSHTGPDGSTLVSRVEAAGFPFTVQVGEVLAWGSNGWPPADIVQAWMNSPSHYAQIMGAVYTRAGVGCYFTREATLTVRCAMDLAG
ncbi:MAG: CAP domain-containing protein [Chloroflexi bacterium]|nr:CAP domain-containing protein [Chloroflexota bacterium]